MKTLRFLYLIFLVVLVSIPGAILVWGFLSGFHSARTYPYGTPGVGYSYVQIVCAAPNGSTVLVKLDFPGAGPSIVAVYVTPVNGSPYGGALASRVEFLPPVNGTVVSVDVQKAAGGAGKILETGDVVKVITADGAQAAMYAGAYCRDPGSILKDECRDLSGRIAIE